MECDLGEEVRMALRTSTPGFGEVPSQSDKSAMAKFHKLSLADSWEFFEPYLKSIWEAVRCPDDQDTDSFALDLFRGENDVPTLDLMRENLASMIDLAKASGAEVILTGIQIPPNYGPRYTAPFFEIYSALAKQKLLPLVPFLIDGIPQQPELMQNDGIHPRAEAQSMILDNVWLILKPQLEILLKK